MSGKVRSAKRKGRYSQQAVIDPSLVASPVESSVSIKWLDRCDDGCTYTRCTVEVAVSKEAPEESEMDECLIHTLVENADDVSRLPLSTSKYARVENHLTRVKRCPRLRGRDFRLILGTSNSPICDRIAVISLWGAINSRVVWVV